MVLCQGAHREMARPLATDRKLTVTLVDVEDPLPVVPGDGGVFKR